MEEREADAERLRKEVVRLENARAQAKARKEAAMAAAASDALKLQGNDAFGAARYEEAVGLYTDALGHAPRNGVLYANRALALLKLHAHAEAEEDCDAALLLDPSNVKAMLRRAQARHATEQYDLALEDLEAALEREPKNAGARSLMAECRRLKAAATPKPKPKLVPITIEACKHDPDNDDDPFVNTLAPLTPPPQQQPVKVMARRQQPTRRLWWILAVLRLLLLTVLLMAVVLALMARQRPLLPDRRRLQPRPRQRLRARCRQRLQQPTASGRHRRSQRWSARGAPYATHRTSLRY